MHTQFCKIICFLSLWKSSCLTFPTPAFVFNAVCERFTNLDALDFRDLYRFLSKHKFSSPCAQAVLDTVHVTNFVQSRYCRLADWFFHLCAGSLFDFLRVSPFIKRFTIIFFGKVWVDRCIKPQFLKRYNVCLFSIDIVLWNSSYA